MRKPKLGNTEFELLVGHFRASESELQETSQASFLICLQIVNTHASEI